MEVSVHVWFAFDSLTEADRPCAASAPNGGISWATRVGGDEVSKIAISDRETKPFAVVRSRLRRVIHAVRVLQVGTVRVGCAFHGLHGGVHPRCTHHTVFTDDNGVFVATATTEGVGISVMSSATVVIGHNVQLWHSTVESTLDVLLILSIHLFRGQNGDVVVYDGRLHKFFSGLVVETDVGRVRPLQQKV